MKYFCLNVKSIKIAKICKILYVNFLNIRILIAKECKKNLQKCKAKYMKAILVLKEGMKLVYFGAKVYYRARHGKNKFALGKIISQRKQKFLRICQT